MFHIVIHLISLITRIFYFSGLVGLKGQLAYLFISLGRNMIRGLIQTPLGKKERPLRSCSLLIINKNIFQFNIQTIALSRVSWNTAGGSIIFAGFLAKWQLLHTMRSVAFHEFSRSWRAKMGYAFEPFYFNILHGAKQ